MRSLLGLQERYVKRERNEGQNQCKFWFSQIVKRGDRKHLFKLRPLAWTHPRTTAALPLTRIWNSFAMCPLYNRISPGEYMHNLSSTASELMKPALILRKNGVLSSKKQTGKVQSCVSGACCVLPFGYRLYGPLASIHPYTLTASKSHPARTRVPLFSSVPASSTTTRRSPPTGRPLRSRERATSRSAT